MVASCPFLLWQCIHAHPGQQAGEVLHQGNALCCQVHALSFHQASPRMPLPPPEQTENHHLQPPTHLFTWARLGSSGRGQQKNGTTTRSASTTTTRASSNHRSLPGTLAVPTGGRVGGSNGRQVARQAPHMPGFLPLPPTHCTGNHGNFPRKGKLKYIAITTHITHHQQVGMGNKV